MEVTLNIFTLNCWGIPIISKNKRERIEAISEYLSKGIHNIVFLQEIWSESDFFFFKKNLVDVLPYSHFFYSGVVGSGLCVFSKWQIQDVFFHQWPLNGYIHKVHHGDWFGGKGVGLCRVKCNGILINLYCTHFHAEYHEDDIYLAHRMLQAYSTGEFVKLTSPSAELSILAGDLNCEPRDLTFRLLSQISSLVDAYDVAVEENSEVKPFGTCDNINNSYSCQKLAQASPEGKRIDHILFSNNSDWKVKVQKFCNPLESRIPGQPFSYSDHNAVSLELQLTQAEYTVNKSMNGAINKCEDPTLNETILEAIKICNEAMRSLIRTKKLYLTTGGLIFMFLIGTVGMWPNRVLYDMFKIILTGINFYYLLMGTLWNRIETNSLKAGINGLKNLSGRKNE